MFRLDQQNRERAEDDEQVHYCIPELYAVLTVSFLCMQDGHEEQTMERPSRGVDEWMLVCQRYANFQPDISVHQDYDRSEPARAYSNLEEMPSFIDRQRQSTAPHSFSTTADPQCLQGKQLQAYNIVQEHFNSHATTPLRMIISGTYILMYLLNLIPYMANVQHFLCVCVSLSTNTNICIAIFARRNFTSKVVSG